MPINAIVFKDFKSVQAFKKRLATICKNHHCKAETQLLFSNTGHTYLLDDIIQSDPVELQKLEITFPAYDEKLYSIAEIRELARAGNLPSLYLHRTLARFFTENELKSPLQIQIICPIRKKELYFATYNLNEKAFGDYEKSLDYIACISYLFSNMRLGPYHSLNMDHAINSLRKTKYATITSKMTEFQDKKLAGQTLTAVEIKQLNRLKQAIEEHRENCISLKNECLDISSKSGFLAQGNLVQKEKALKELRKKNVNNYRQATLGIASVILLILLSCFLFLLPISNLIAGSVMTLLIASLYFSYRHLKKTTQYIANIDHSIKMNDLMIKCMDNAQKSMCSAITNLDKMIDQYTHHINQANDLISNYNSLSQNNDALSPSQSSENSFILPEETPGEPHARFVM